MHTTWFSVIFTFIKKHSPIPASVLEMTIRGVVFGVQIESVFAAVGQFDGNDDLSVHLACDDVLAKLRSFPRVTVQLGHNLHRQGGLIVFV